jgi:microsomal prostaglandin-E synthase 2
LNQNSTQSIQPIGLTFSLFSINMTIRRSGVNIVERALLWSKSGVASGHLSPAAAQWNIWKISSAYSTSSQAKGVHTSSYGSRFGWSAAIGMATFAAGMMASKESFAKNASEEDSNPYSLEQFQASEKFPSSFVLYQYEVCPFCCKVKAFLDYHRIPYRVVEVDPLGKSELKWSDYKKVPVILLDGSRQLNNSSSIISQLAVDMQQNDPAKQSSGGSWSLFSSKQADGSSDAHVRSEWRRWVDEKLVRAITVNIYRTAKESFQTFDYITEHGNFGWAQRQAARVVGATMMWSLSNRLKKKYDIEGDVREALYKLADQWVDGLDGNPFMGGMAPSLADIEAFGVIKSIVGTDTFNDLQHETRISSWYERMMNAVGDSARIE